MKNNTEIFNKLEALFRKLINSEYIERNSENDFTKWEFQLTADKAVYLLWESKSDFNENKRPVYIGEGILGQRIGRHYWEKRNWKYLQFITDNDLKDLNLRKLFERYCIAILNPSENRN